jgi:hypothetical protein
MRPAAVANSNDLSLFRTSLTRLLLPPVLLVSQGTAMQLLRIERRLIYSVSTSVRYSKMLEENTFHGRRADYLWLMIVSSSLLLVRT